MNLLTENVNELNKDTLLSDELFQELFEAYDDIDRTRKIIELQERAKIVGCKQGFDDLMKEYKKAIRQNSNSFMYETNFSLPKEKNYPVLVSGCWKADDKDISCQTMFGIKTACTHPILPIQILTNAETKTCKVKLAFKIRGSWKEVCVDKETLASSNKIVELAKYGIRVTSENSKALVQYLSDVESLNEDVIQEQISTGHLGWINEEFMPYGKNIVFDNEQALRTVFESLTEPQGNVDTWIQLVKKLRKIGRIEFLIYQAASFGSPLIELVNGLPFVLSIWGLSGRGKTVNMMLATSIWANPSEGKYISSSEATSTASELKMSFLKNLPFVVDDLAQINRRDIDFSSLVMSWCSGRSKDRGTKNVGLRESLSWKCCIITNSEHSMVEQNMRGGAVNRIIEVPIGDTEIFQNPNGHEIVSIINENYGFVGRQWIEILQEVGIDSIRQMQEKYYDLILTKTKGTDNEKEEKQILPMSIMLTADELTEKYIFRDGIRLNVDRCISYLKNKSEVNENERAYQFLVDEIARNNIKFTHIVNGKEEDRAMLDTWGVIDEDKHQVILISSVLTDILKREGYSVKTFLSWASEKGMLEEAGDKKHPHLKQKRLKGFKPWCVWLSVEDGNEFVEVENDDDIPFE